MITRRVQRFLVFIFLLMSVACNAAGTNVEPETAAATTAPLPEATKPLMIRVHNNSGRVFDSVEVRFPEQTEEYGVVGVASSSDYHAVSQAYRYAYVQVMVGGQFFALQPIDYVGESLLSPGEYTYVLDIVGGQVFLDLVEGDEVIVDEPIVIVQATAVPPTEVAPTEDATTDLNGTRWELVAYGAKDRPASVLPSTQVTAEFRDGQVAGSTGCNQYSASFTQSGDTLTTSPVISTRRACAEDVGQQEAQILQGLDTAVTYEVSNDTLTIQHESGVLVFVAAAEFQPEITDEAPESILIFSPGLGSAVTSPFTITGESDFVFEGTLSVEVVSLSGETTQPIGKGFAMLDVAEMGQRGPYSGEITFAPPTEPTPGRISVFSISARDGHIEHLASVMVTLLPDGGTAEMITADPQPDAIAIYSPARLATLTGGMIQIAGYAAPTFEQNLSIEVLDANGEKVGEGSALIASDMGEWGSFTADVDYSVTAETPGTLCVTDFSPADGGIVHRTCMPVTLAP